MSESSLLALPTKPNLNWLKNRAKEKLEHLRAADPAAKLAAAQLAVAREYGFSNWQKLRKHIAAMNIAADVDPELVNRFVATIRGHVEIVRQMLDEHPQLAHATNDGRSMLHEAGEYNRIAAIRLLAQRGADPNVYWVGVLHTPLSWAVVNHNPQACDALIECGAKVDLFCAAGMGRLDDVAACFDGEGKIKPGASITGSSRRRSDGSWIMELSSDPTEIMSDAMYMACRNGFTDVALYLLDRGGDPNFRSYMNATCLHWAHFGGGEPKLITAMIAKGGDPQATCGDRQITPRAFGILTAAGWGWKYKLNRILDNDPSLIHLFEGGTTPLHEAARHGQIDATKFLLSRGANASQIDGDGKTALDRAIESGHHTVAELLKR
jgi:ankyrin repeat protein